MQNIKGKRIHFVGVNGSGVSGLMIVSHRLGAIVSGSDMVEGEYFNTLKELGLNVYTGINTDIAGLADLVVYSSAVKTSHPELQNNNAISRGEFLGYISKFFKKTIAIAGTHGKTTTSCMISHVLRLAKKKYCYIIGGIDAETERNSEYFGNDILVVEACEYKDNFLFLNPTVSVITSIEFDHPDYFKSFDNLVDSFTKFANNTTTTVVLGENVEKLVKCTSAHKCICAFEHTMPIWIENNTICYYGEDNKISTFTPIQNQEFNLKNAVLAYLVLTELGIDKKTIVEGLSNFVGVKRRQEFLGYYNNSIVISDYAHHPTQIKNLIATYIKNKTVTLFFEPHTYSRTKQLMNDFKTCFIGVDTLVILPVYSAREDYDIDGDSKTLFKNITNKNKVLVNSYQEAEKVLRNIHSDIVLIVGAGSIDAWIRNTLINP